MLLQDEERTQLREHVADRLARPFPIAVDGTLRSFEWDGSALTVSMVDAGRGEHVISAPGRLWTDPSATCDGRDVDVRLEPGRAHVGCRGEELVVR